MIYVASLIYLTECKIKACVSHTYFFLTEISFSLSSSRRIFFILSLSDGLVNNTVISYILGEKTFSPPTILLTSTSFLSKSIRLVWYQTSRVIYIQSCALVEPPVSTVRQQDALHKYVHVEWYFSRVKWGERVDRKVNRGAPIYMRFPE